MPGMDDPRDYCEPAASILALLGGIEPVVGWLGVAQSTVCRFRHPKAIGGRDGFIPRRYWDALIAMGRDKCGVELVRGDFVRQSPLTRDELVARKTSGELAAA